MQTTIKAILGAIMLTYGALTAQTGILNVKDFGAKGDLKTDDSDAIQKAIDATAWTMGDPSQIRPVTVFFPPGHYLVRKTLKIRHENKNLTLVGAGSVSPYGGLPGDDARPLPPGGTPSTPVPFGPTQLIWGGAEGGTLLEWTSADGVVLRHLALIGSDKAGTLLSINSAPGTGSGLGTLERCLFTRARIGIECGQNGINANAADLTLTDLMFFDLGVGFKTTQSQNVDYCFIRPMAFACGCALWFAQGGSADVYSLATRRTPLVIRIDGGGIQNGTFHFSNLRVDVNSVGTNVLGGNPWSHEYPARPVVLLAKGEVNVKFTSLCVMGERRDRETPIFSLDTHAQVSVESSMLSGPVAVLRGKAGNLPTWIQFDQCRFRMGADPREILCDEFSGYELRNCSVTVEADPSKGNYAPIEKTFIPSLSRLPTRLTHPPAK